MIRICSIQIFGIRTGRNIFFVKEHSHSKNEYSEEDFIRMLEFLVDSIFEIVAVFQQTVGIPIDTNCAPTSRLHLSVFLQSGVSYSLCFQWNRNSYHIASISLTDTEINVSECK